MNSCLDKMLSRNTIVTASYKVISDFESSSEKECSKVDSANEKMYSKLLTQAQKAQDTIKHTGLSMNLEVPIPPRPSNRDRYILWQKRNVSKKVIDQTEAVLYLNANGYLYNEHYEAYQAIDLANEIKKTKGDSTDLKDESNNFENVYTKDDKNILRLRSIHTFNRELQIPSDNINEQQNTESEDKYPNDTSIQRRPTQRRPRGRTSLYGFETQEFEGFNEYFSNTMNNANNDLNNVSFNNIDNTLTQYYRQSVMSPEPLSATPPPPCQNSLNQTQHNPQFNLENPQQHQQSQHHQTYSSSEGHNIHHPSQHQQPHHPYQQPHHPYQQPQQAYPTYHHQSPLNYCNIEHQNTLINNVKPSAPPASTNVTFTKSNVQSKIDALSERC